jgi:hypothetical protein
MRWFGRQPAPIGAPDARLLAPLEMSSILSRCSPDVATPDYFGRPIGLDGDQIGKLGRDVRHRLFCRAQAASRGEQGANFAESFKRRLVHHGNETLTREECRKFFVGDAFCWEAAQQRRGHQHDPDPRVR